MSARQSPAERRAQLSRWRKADLIAWYRRGAYVGSAYPLERWSKEEIVNAIIETEGVRT